jgi:hypothetical protein
MQEKDIYEIGITNSFGCILKDTIYLLGQSPTKSNVADSDTKSDLSGRQFTTWSQWQQQLWHMPGQDQTAIHRALKNPVINGITPVRIRSIYGDSDQLKRM